MRLRQFVRHGKQELHALGDASRQSGGRDALIGRAKDLLGLEELDDRLSTDFEQRLEQGLSDLDTRLLKRLDELEAHADELRDEIEATRAVLDDTRQHLRSEREANDRHRREHALHALVGPVTEWVRQATLGSRPLISVIMASRNRSALLRRAVESVEAQVYDNWELVVVDDGSTDETAALLADLSSRDERINVISQSALGVSAARNAGLSAAHGEYVAYLDDDNLMQPLWLKAVAWAIERRPEVDVLYGARIADGDVHEDNPLGLSPLSSGSGDIGGSGTGGSGTSGSSTSGSSTGGSGTGGIGDGGTVIDNVSATDANGFGLPYLHFEAFDRARLEDANFIDLGVIAHRRNLTEAIFDESLESLVDWDLMLRLTADRTPLALPVLASLYTTAAPDRISRSGRFLSSQAAIRTKLLRERPLRVLAYNHLFPLVPETYMAEEMRALTDNGTQLAWCTDKWSPSPVRVAEPTYTDLDTAVSDFQPDVLFLFWATFAHARLEVLTRIGKPFALRVHSFDFDEALIEQVRRHPLCVGIWAFPHHAVVIPGAHELEPLLADHEDLPDPGGERHIVLSASAALPKKDWPLLVSAFAELARGGVDCRIIVGLTNLHEDEPKLIRELIAESGAQVMLSVDVPRDQMLELLGRTAVVVYTKVPGGPFGMPQSIIEGMYAGASVIMPDRPESQLTGGPDCRIYRRPEDVVRHVREILAGGPAIEAERRANRLFVERHFADPTRATAFAADLAKAVAGWKTSRS
ncbi:MAG TPA: glycosyltransferase [Acidimicrobiales bacterium]|nr:glycosyltransferase [Acidimicrobiales bacterium]